MMNNKTQIKTFLDNGEYHAATKALQEQTKSDPQNETTWHQLGSVYQNLLDWQNATDCLEKALSLSPDSSKIFHDLIITYCASKRHKQAFELCTQLLNKSKKNLRAMIGLGYIYYHTNDYITADKHLRKAIKLAPRSTIAHALLGEIRFANNDTQRALNSFIRAKELSPDDTKYTLNLIRALEVLGEHDQAANLLKPLLTKKHIRFTTALLAARLCKPLNLCNKIAEYITPHLESKLLDATDKARAHFAMGDVYNKTGEYKLAFSHYKQGNDIRATNNNTIEQDKKFTDALINVYTKKFLTSTPRATLQDESIQPVFIVGILRSGTSLLEQILDSHPKIAGLGELPEISDIAIQMQKNLRSDKTYPYCAQAANKEYLNKTAKKHIRYLSRLAHGKVKILIDKAPVNYQSLGLIEMLFPNAKIIHCQRNPLDTCLSCYFQDFAPVQPTTCSLANLGHAYNSYTRMMQHWKSVLSIPIIDINYEDLVTTPETTITNLLTHLNVDWDEKCLEFYKNKRQVKTASYVQVKQPLHKGSIARWKNYEPWLDELINIIPDTEHHTQT